MKKKLALLVVVILMLLVSTSPALAKQRQPAFTFGGYITAVGDDSITIRTLKDRLVTVQIIDTTIFLRWTADGRVPSSFGEIEVGDSANIRGTLSGDIYIASQVTVDVPLKCTLLGGHRISSGFRGTH